MIAQESLPARAADLERELAARAKEVAHWLKKARIAGWRGLPALRDEYEGRARSARRAWADTRTRLGPAADLDRADSNASA